MVVEDLAEALGMQLIKGGKPGSIREYQTALLTRLPIVYTKSHDRPGTLMRPLLEVCVEEANGQHLTIFVGSSPRPLLIMDGRVAVFVCVRCMRFYRLWLLYEPLGSRIF